jgi:hypothetical protein
MWSVCTSCSNRRRIPTLRAHPDVIVIAFSNSSSIRHRISGGGIAQSMISNGFASCQLLQLLLVD